MSDTAAAVLTEFLAPDEGPPMGAFARALREGKGAPLAFLDPPPRDEEGWSALLARTAELAPTVPVALAEALAERQRALGAGDRAVANALALADPEQPALAVVTGQQPGLLGGPLLTFHKIAGAINLARKLDGLDGRRVIPIFWLASEDHDLDEANRALVIDGRGQPRGLRLDLEADGRSLVDVEVAEGLSDALAAELAAALPDTERGAAVRALAARQGDEDFGTWAARIVAAVFGDSGLVIVEPLTLTPWVGETYGWLLDNAETVREAVHATGDRLLAADLPAPLHPQDEGATPLFFRADAGSPRLRVGTQGDGVTLRGEPAEMSRADLRATLVSAPEQGSGNVIGRVFVQNRHLPTLAYIAGPAEIAYHAQVRAAHEALGLVYPLALPRPEGTWVDAKTRATLEAFGVEIGEVLRGVETPPQGDAALDAELDAVGEYVAGASGHAEDLRARGGQGAQALSQALARVTKAWERARASVRAAFERDAGVDRARYDRALALLRPTGKGQDRVLSPLSLAARYGLASLRAGLESMDPLRPSHHLVHLGGGASAPKDERS